MQNLYYSGFAQPGSMEETNVICFSLKAFNLKYIKGLILLLLIIPFLNISLMGQSVPAGVPAIPVPNPKAGTTGFGIDGDLNAYTGQAIANDPAIYPFPSIPASAFSTAGDWIPDNNGEGGVLSSTGSVVSPGNPPRKFHIVDNYGASDDIFKGGSKINSDPNGVKWVIGGPNPSKNDINHALIYITEATNGDIWAAMAGDRATKEGSSFIAFQFLQKALTRNSTGFESAGLDGGRTVGDIQVTVEFVNGGAVPKIYYETWQSSGNSFTWVSIPNTNIPAGAAFGRTNSVDLTNLPYSAFGGTTYATNLFAEVAVNISEVYKNVPTTCIGKISTLWVVTKASHSPSANMTDFVEPIQLDLDINVSADAGPDKTICAGGSTTIGTAAVSGFTYSWSPTTGLSAANIAQPTASPSTTTTYTVTVTKAGSTCSTTDQVVVTVNQLPTITGPSIGAICAGTTSTSLSYTGVTNGANQYKIVWNPAAETAGLVSMTAFASLTSSPISLTVPGTLAAATYSGTIYVKNSTTTCESTGTSISLLVNSNPTITNPVIGAICQGTSSAALSYTGVSSGVDQYKIVWNSGLTSMSSFVTLPSSPITISGTGSLAANTYTGTIYVKNSTTGCISAGDAVSLLVNGLPSITGPAIGPLCPGESSASLSYTGITNGANQYKIVWNSAAEQAGLVSMVAFAALPASPITIGNTSTLTANTYNGTLYAKNSNTGCESSGSPVSLTVNASPSGPTVDYLYPACDETTFSLRIRNVVTGSSYTVLDKNGNAISGISPTSPYTALTNANIVFSNIPAGSGYMVTETTTSGCLSEATTCGVSSSRQMNPTIINGVKNGMEKSENLKAFPVPFSKKVTIQFTMLQNENYVVNLFDMQGRLVTELKAGDAKSGEIISIEVDGQKLPESMYLVRKISRSGIETIKILKKE